MASFEMLCKDFIESEEEDKSRKIAILSIEICIQATKNANTKSDVSTSLGRAQGVAELACMLGLIDFDEYMGYWSRANAAAQNNLYWN